MGKQQKRPDTPLAATPEYNADASTLASSFKKILTDSAARKAAAYAERKVSSNKRREAMSSKGKQSGGGLKGLNTGLGGKIVR